MRVVGITDQGEHVCAQIQPIETAIRHKRALVAVAHALGKAIYYVLATDQPFRDAQPELLNVLQRQRLIRHCTTRRDRCR